MCSPIGQNAVQEQAAVVHSAAATQAVTAAACTTHGFTIIMCERHPSLACTRVLLDSWREEFSPPACPSQIKV